jgi:hypothetical protein
MSSTPSSSTKIETGMAAIEAELESAAQDKPSRTCAASPERLAAHLEGGEIVIEPEIPAGCEELEKVLIGEDRDAGEVPGDRHAPAEIRLLDLASHAGREEIEIAILKFTLTGLGIPLRLPPTK